MNDQQIIGSAIDSLQSVIENTIRDAFFVSKASYKHAVSLYEFIARYVSMARLATDRYSVTGHAYNMRFNSLANQVIDFQCMIDVVTESFTYMRTYHVKLLIHVDEFGNAEFTSRDYSCV